MDHFLQFSSCKFRLYVKYNTSKKKILSNVVTRFQKFSVVIYIFYSS